MILKTIVLSIVEAITKKVMAFIITKRLGKMEERNKHLEEGLERAEEAKKIDNLVEFDPDYRERVREEFDKQ